MHRARTVILLLAVGLAGCSKKNKSHDSESQPAGAPVAAGPGPGQPQPPQTHPTQPATIPIGPAPVTTFGQPPISPPTGTPSNGFPPPKPAVPPGTGFPPQPSTGVVPPPQPMVPPVTQPAVPPPDPKLLPMVPGTEPPKDEPKKEPAGPTKPKWPADINGRTLQDYIKDLTNPDPMVRELALKTIPGFGPAARTAGRPIIQRLGIAEDDPGVKITAYSTLATMYVNGLATEEVGLEDKDVEAAVLALGNAADQAPLASYRRLQAVQALAAFGSKADSAVYKLTAAPAQDPSYLIRQAVAETLGSIGSHEKTGPNPRALASLCGRLLEDKSVAVRLAAVRSLIVLGPPWKVNKGGPAPKPKEQPLPDPVAAAAYFGPLKKRLMPHTSKVGTPHPTGLVEPDKQVEIWVRFAVLRFDTKIDPKELDDVLDGVCKFLAGTERGPKLQALNALSLLGEIGARRIDKVVKVMLADEDLDVVAAAVTTLGSMGTLAKPVIPELEKLGKKYADLRDAQLKKFFAEKKINPELLKKEDMKIVLAQVPAEHIRALSEQAIKVIKEAKPPGEKK